MEGFVSLFACYSLKSIEVGSPTNPVEIRSSTGDARQRVKRFSFEEMWLHGDGCEDVVVEPYNREFGGAKLFQVCSKIKATQVVLLD